MPDFEALEKEFLASKKENGDSGDDDFMSAVKTLQSEFFSTQNSTASKMSIDTEAHMRDMRSFLMKKNNEKPIVQEITEKQVSEVREKVRSDVFYDMKAEVNATVQRHATNVSLTQIQKIQYSSNDNMKEEINELKRMLTKNVAMVDKLDGKCQEYDMRLPRVETDIGTIRADINSKASREEIQNLHTNLKDFVSKQDLEFI